MPPDADESESVRQDLHTLSVAESLSVEQMLTVKEFVKTVKFVMGEVFLTRAAIMWKDVTIIVNVSAAMNTAVEMFLVNVVDTSKWLAQDP
jgi:hypothetical protein